MHALTLLLLLTGPFPSGSQTSWMRPESFHLRIGMTRAEATAALEDAGWKTKAGRDENQLVVDYADDKAMTLNFRRDRLHSLRFELFAFLPYVRRAFEEEKTFLEKTLGEPKSGLRSKSVILYDHTLPNVMVVLSDAKDSENGRKGIGMLAVRYFDPATAR
jgi:hypothetical protein